MKTKQTFKKNHKNTRTLLKCVTKIKMKTEKNVLKC